MNPYMTLDRRTCLNLFTYLTPICKTLNYLDNIDKPDYGVSVSSIYILKYLRKDGDFYIFTGRNNAEVSASLPYDIIPKDGDVYAFIGCLDNYRLKNKMFLIHHGVMILQSNNKPNFRVSDEVCSKYMSYVPTGLADFKEFLEKDECRQFYIDVSPKMFDINTDPINSVQYNKNKESDYCLNSLMQGNEPKLVINALIIRDLLGIHTTNKELYSIARDIGYGTGNAEYVAKMNKKLEDIEKDLKNED